jgi:hypothetical protein
MGYKMDDAQKQALADLKAAAEVFCKAITTFDSAVPECSHGGADWIEHIQGVIFDIEAEVDDEDE